MNKQTTSIHSYGCCPDPPFDYSCSIKEFHSFCWGVFGKFQVSALFGAASFIVYICATSLSPSITPLTLTSNYISSPLTFISFTLNSISSFPGTCSEPRPIWGSRQGLYDSFPWPFVRAGWGTERTRGATRAAVQHHAAPLPGHAGESSSSVHANCNL